MSHCPGPDPGSDGYCRSCGRPTSLAAGRLEHKRGRWREPLGLPQVNPRRLVTAIPPTIRLRCVDCAAPLQLVGGAWRCPWTTRRRRRLEGGLTYCDWPYRKEHVA